MNTERSKERMEQYVIAKLKEMRNIAELYKLLNAGEEIHKVNLIRYVFKVRPGKTIRYKLACKIYEYGKQHNYF